MKFDLTNAVCIPGLYSEGNEAMRKAIDEKAIVIKNKDMEMMLKEDELQIEYKQNRIQMDKDRVRLKCGERSLAVNQERVEIDGDLFVKGSIVEGG
jgi:hypothetical protein